MLNNAVLHMIINSTKLFTDSWSRAGTVYYVVNDVVIFIKGYPSIMKVPLKLKRLFNIFYP